MRIAISWIAIFSFGLSYPCGAFAQSRNVPPERWQAVDKSMTDLLLEGRANGPPLQQLQAFRFAWLPLQPGPPDTEPYWPQDH